MNILLRDMHNPTKKLKIEAHSILPPHHHTSHNEPHKHGPKIIEVLLMGPADIEMMILHLNMLEEVVDHFVVVESDVTFQGKKKPLLFANPLKL